MKKNKVYKFRWLAHWTLIRMTPDHNDLAERTRIYFVKKPPCREFSAAGVMVTREDWTYDIYIDEALTEYQTAAVLVHEIRHVVQVHTRMLSGNYYWQGFEYSKDLPWKERPWEKDASYFQYWMGKQALDAYKLENSKHPVWIIRKIFQHFITTMFECALLLTRVRR